MADKIVVMNNAVIEQVGTPKEIYNVPKTAFTANFIGTMNLYQQDKMLLGVRPEMIEITRTARAGDAGYCRGIIEEIEFREHLPVSMEDYRTARKSSVRTWIPTRWTASF